MEEELIKIIRKMESAGESKQAISAVVKAYTESGVKKKSYFRACWAYKGHYGLFYRNSSGKSYFLGFTAK